MFISSFATQALDVKIFNTSPKKREWIEQRDLLLVQPSGCGFNNIYPNKTSNHSIKQRDQSLEMITAILTFHIYYILHLQISEHTAYELAVLYINYIMQCCQLYSSKIEVHYISHSHFGLWISLGRPLVFDLCLTLITKVTRQ